MNLASPGAFPGPTAQPHTSLGRCPTAIKLSLEALVTRARSQAPAWERDREFLNLMAVGRCPRLAWGRAVGAERLSPTGRFIGSLRRACPESVEGISRGNRDVRFSRRAIGTDGSSGRNRFLAPCRYPVIYGPPGDCDPPEEICPAPDRKQARFFPSNTRCDPARPDAIHAAFASLDCRRCPCARI